MSVGARVASLVVAVLAVSAVLVVFLRSGPTPGAEAGAEVTAPIDHGLGRVRVEVLNAGGVNGLAKTARDELRTAGFDVVFFGNAETSEQDSSEVIDRVGDLERAEAVAKALGIRTIRSEPDSNLYLEVSVRLGSTWEPEGRRR